ncbi:aspartyl protease family protein [Massilia sp. Leaf139]|uniref:aspartyl protease family protein n=1 Tax=Massilia sp. Leaf139 TaxID=1736272 RepID=UPI000700FB05|nr:aspartyl protease family protein [Massilia sp. Leaf139]KQQ87427.1 hypothetical protein ASF77_17855 [Massilia sp. Leaf139]
MARLSPRATLAFCALLFPFAAQGQADVPKCRYAEVGSLPLRYTGPGLALTTEGSINGTPATMLVDTGAFDTVLTKTGTERRKLFMRATGHYARGIGGSATIYQARVDEISAGPTKSGRTWLPVLADFGFAPSFDAIIGAPFLLQADMELSLATKELRFFRPTGCSDRFLAYWDEAAMEIPFEGNSGRSPNPQFTVLINGKKMRAMIDTGAASTVIGRKAAERAGLKLDGSGATRLGDSAGIGAERVAHWSATVETFQIAEETVKNAEIGVLDWDGGVDILLGADFLRAHRVLFAMSQQKIYLSYIGGDPFGQRRKLEPWLQQEADAGNGDAQMVLAQIYRAGKIVPQDRALAASWLEKAARAGNPQANIISGREMMLKGFPEDGAARIRSALDKLPSNHDAALWLYIARVRSKQLELAKTELAAHFARNEDKAWPEPVADFYLGKMGEEALLKTAAAQSATAKARTCEALTRMSEWHHVHGDLARAKALSEQFRAGCGRSESGT